MGDYKVYCKKCGRLLEKRTSPGTAYLERVALCADYGRECRDAKMYVEGVKIESGVGDG